MSSAALRISPLDVLLEVLSLKRQSGLCFEGSSFSQGLSKVFGGQLAAQGLSAAQQTVDADRHAHSLQAEFFRGADPDLPLRFVVDRVRDTRAFTTRRVTVEQSGTTVCGISVSFHIEEKGFEHQQAAMPTVPPPGDLETEGEIGKRYIDGLPTQVRAMLPPAIVKRVLGERPFELRPVSHFSDPMFPGKLEPKQDIWFRTTSAPPLDPQIHLRLLTFASDFHFLGTAMRPHGVTLLSPGIVASSLDHSMWFHRPARTDDWLLHSMDSPTAQAARGFSRGQWFDRRGVLLASTAQECLFRRR